MIKKRTKNFNVKSLEFSVKDSIKIKKEYKEYEILAQNIFFTRDLVSEAPNVLNPESYAKICQELTKDGLKVKIIGEKEMKKLGMNAILGVGQGSSFESKLVILELQK